MASENNKTEVPVVQSESEDRLKDGSPSTEHKDKPQEKGGPSLEDLCSTLMQQINSSDWLKENTAEKWAKENPELSKELKDAANKSW